MMCLCLIYGWAGTQHQLKKYSEKVSILVFTCHKFSSALCWAEPSLSDNGQRFIFMEGASCLQIKTSRLNHPDTETHTLLLMLIKIDIKLKFDKKYFSSRSSFLMLTLSSGTPGYHVMKEISKKQMLKLEIYTNN